MSSYGRWAHQPLPGGFPDRRAGLSSQRPAVVFLPEAPESAVIRAQQIARRLGFRLKYRAGWELLFHEFRNLFDRPIDLVLRVFSEGSGTVFEVDALSSAGRPAETEGARKIVDAFIRMAGGARVGRVRRWGIAMLQGFLFPVVGAAWVAGVALWIRMDLWTYVVVVLAVFGLAPLETLVTRLLLGIATRRDVFISVAAVAPLVICTIVLVMLRMG